VPVIDLTSTWLHAETSPDWLTLTGVGRFHLDVTGARFDRHHHAHHELWYIVSGKGLVETEGDRRYVQAGDLVMTRAGETHDFVEIYESIDGLFIEMGLPDGTAGGHLYADDADRGGHTVAALPLPTDFPNRA
jgi:mannose-6-phosphate isomerase-like protein (cupin superfamily)